MYVVRTFVLSLFVRRTDVHCTDPVSGAHLHYAPEVMKFKLKIRNMRDFTRERLMYQTRQIMDVSSL